MSLSLSLHARQRMDERNISLSEVQACLRKGRPMKARPGQIRIFHRDLVVVHDGTLVITTFRRECLLAKLCPRCLSYSLADKLLAALGTLDF
ncbi:MAG: hypothetical protein ACI9VR_000359 [Cognaticolwellia sp.]|jgi:hypothetical protein